MNRRKQSNPIKIAPLAKWLGVAVILGIAGLGFVYIKHQQFALGEQTRQHERSLREVRAYNQVLETKIATLTSRTELQRKLLEGLVQMMPIQDTRIARLTPPSIAVQDGVLRTAATTRENFAQ